MNTSRASGLPGAGRPYPGTLGEILNDAVRYWEKRRVAYNLVLFAVCVAWLVVTWPHFRSALTVQSLVAGLVLAAVANVCYCTAYIADVAMQRSSFQAVWRRQRWGVWLLGTLVAAALTYYWIADEIYPYVG